MKITPLIESIAIEWLCHLSFVRCHLMIIEMGHSPHNWKFSIKSNQSMFDHLVHASSHYPHTTMATSTSHHYHHHHHLSWTKRSKIATTTTTTMHATMAYNIHSSWQQQQQWILFNLATLRTERKIHWASGENNWNKAALNVVRTNDCNHCYVTILQSWPLW